jgi:hypothetical protein
MLRLLLLPAFFLFACRPDRPKDVMSSEKMQAVLYDVIRADEMVDFLRLSDSSYQPFSRRTGLYDTVFHLHGVNKETFNKSMRYYQGRPDLLRGILEGMLEKTTDTSARRGARPPESYGNP